MSCERRRRRDKRSRKAGGKVMLRGGKGGRKTGGGCKGRMKRRVRGGKEERCLGEYSDDGGK